MEVKNLILGAGIAGLGASHALNYDCFLIEKNKTYGGLLDTIEYKGFLFDQAVHLSFADEGVVKSLFDKVKHLNHKPISKNYKNGIWINHPIQSNLKPLPLNEKIRIFLSICLKPKKNNDSYYNWLLNQFGYYFTNNYHELYTNKYWCESSKNLSTEWIGPRVFKPKLANVFKSIFLENKRNDYYIKDMRYPKEGAYKAFLGQIANKSKIMYEKEVHKIDPVNKIVFLKDNNFIKYENLFSSLPLPHLVNAITDSPQEIKNIAKKLYTTSVALVSIGFNKTIDFPSIWFYVYDDEIPFARAYSPSIKSPSNAPINMSSLQCEIYYSKNKPLIFTAQDLQEKVIKALIKMKLCKNEDVLFTRTDFIKFANVVFYKGMEDDRFILKKFISKYNIKSIGRFGEWDYLWSHQSFMSGYNSAITFSNK